MTSNTTTPRFERLASAHEQLCSAVSALTTGTDWQQMLDVAKRFHHYSANNLLLILTQCPGASRIAGYRGWQQLGRQVRSGERGIAILAPCFSKSKADPAQVSPQAANDDHTASGSPDTAKRVLSGFRVFHVFDIAQTDGNDLPEVTPTALTGDAPTQLWGLLAHHLEVSGFKLLRGDTGHAYATTNFTTRIVVVRSGLSPAQAVKSLAHEVAHTMLHNGTEYAAGCQGITEVEAESVAYLVCGVAGIATDQYSFPYVARWADGDIELVKKTTDRVVGCAHKLITTLGLDGVSDGEGAP